MSVKALFIAVLADAGTRICKEAWVTLGGPEDLIKHWEDISAECRVFPTPGVSGPEE